MIYEKTINKILERITKEIPLAEIGDILETQKTKFPDGSVLREDKNIIINSTEVTPPLACSKTWKNMMKKDKSFLCEIYKDFARGDLLVVKEILKDSVIVENISIEKEFRKPFSISKLEIAKKDFKLIKRRSIELLRSLNKLNYIDGDK